MKQNIHIQVEKKLNFDIKKFSNFKNKIEYIVQEYEPDNIIYETNNFGKKKKIL